MLSVIIPAHNEELHIAGTLGALGAACAAVAAELGEPCEIIVVDDASDDGTADIARRCGARVVSVDHRRISSVRNAGAAAASGEHLVFVDADTTVPAATLLAAARALRAGAAGGGASIEFDRPVPLYARMLMPLVRLIYRAGRLLSGPFTFCRRDAFEAAGGYDDGLVAGEEAALSRALRRQGRVVVLRERITTSGRKLRTHSAGEILGLVIRLGLRPRRTMTDPTLWGILYDPRRLDPASADAGPPSDEPG